MQKPQQGFTLIEIAIVLVIIGLLLGGVLKGQELIQNARVRNIISQQEGIKAAFFAFQDRYRGIAGDYTALLARDNIPGMNPCPAGATCGGDGDGQIEAAGNENIAAWIQLARAGFVTGNYNGVGAAENAANAPANPFGGFIQLINDANYQGAAPVARNNVKTGAGIPSAILGEVDRKIDDGNGNTGEFRFSLFGAAAQACAPVATGIWDVNTGQANCGAASLF